ncbi:hypothetical protein V8E36_002959 [Tilletia maclaganii]
MQCVSHGDGVQGDECALASDCTSLVCRTPPSYKNAVCTTLANGEACSANVMCSGGYCANIFNNSPSTCQPREHLDARCVQDNDCETRRCDNIRLADPKTCLNRHGPQACESDGDCFAGRCVFPGICDRRQFDIGAACEAMTSAGAQSAPSRPATRIKSAPRSRTANHARLTTRARRPCAPDSPVPRLGYAASCPSAHPARAIKITRLADPTKSGSPTHRRASRSETETSAPRQTTVSRAYAVLALSSADVVPSRSTWEPSARTPTTARAVSAPPRPATTTRSAAPFRTVGPARRIVCVRRVDALCSLQRRRASAVESRRRRRARLSARARPQAACLLPKPAPPPDRLRARRPRPRSEHRHRLARSRWLRARHCFRMV